MVSNNQVAKKATWFSLIYFFKLPKCYFNLVIQCLPVLFFSKVFLTCCRHTRRLSRGVAAMLINPVLVMTSFFSGILVALIVGLLSRSALLPLLLPGESVFTGDVCFIPPGSAIPSLTVCPPRCLVLSDVCPTPPVAEFPSRTVRNPLHTRVPYASFFIPGFSALVLQPIDISITRGSNSNDTPPLSPFSQVFP